MILGFSTQINKKPTYFVEKILRGIEFYKAPINLSDFWKYTGYDLLSKQHISPKLHTIREDRTNRWKAGTKIDFFINVRTKDMFRFAPVLPVVSVQDFEVVYDRAKLFPFQKCVILVNGDVLSDVETIHLALNDGFDTVEDFFAYFNEDFKGKLIHWTEKKY